MRDFPKKFHTVTLFLQRIGRIRQRLHFRTARFDFKRLLSLRRQLYDPPHRHRRSCKYPGDLFKVLQKRFFINYLNRTKNVPSFNSIKPKDFDARFVRTHPLISTALPERDAYSLYKSLIFKNINLLLPEKSRTIAARQILLKQNCDKLPGSYFRRDLRTAPENPSPLHFPYPVPAAVTPDTLSG